MVGEVRDLGDPALLVAPHRLHRSLFALCDLLRNHRPSPLRFLTFRLLCLLRQNPRCVTLLLHRLVFRSSSSAMEWAQRNKYFHLISRGVERDGWKFVLLARFSPVPSYVINYTLAATDVRFLLDFLLPTAIGCLPMILQNTSIGSLAGAAVATASGSKKSQIWSYIFPVVGILSSVVISLRIKKYSTQVSVSEIAPKQN
uniref:VTT domain-containing protein n=1 Tax=Glycine max TaxID=3847 RepID=K7MVJ9_SOYBN